MEKLLSSAILPQSETPGLQAKLSRVSLRLRQYDVAAALGVGPPQLSEYESGRRRLAPEKEAKLREILGLPQSPGGGDGQR